jgi:hypothetical protein
MKASELQLKKDGYNFNCNTREGRSHYKFVMSLGRCFPSTRAQAKYFVSEGICLSVLNGDDVEKVEAILNKHGFEGDYKFTKSKTWVRLQNHNELYKALKLEFNF